MQQAIQTQAISVEGVWGKLPGQLPKFLFNIVGHTHIKDALHQRFNRKEMGVDVFQISHRLMDGISRLLPTTDWGGMGLDISSGSAVFFLQILQDPARQGSKRLKGRPTQLLLLTQCW